MNTHTDGLYGNTCKKDFDDIGVSYASCGPTSLVDGWKGSGQSCCYSTSHYDLVHGLTRYSLGLKPNKKQSSWRLRYIRDKLETLDPMQ